MAEEGKLDKIMEHLGIEWVAPVATPTEPAPTNDTPNVPAPEPEKEIPTMDVNPAIESLKEDLAKQAMIMERLAQRPEGTTTVAVEDNMPGLFDVKALEKRVAAELGENATNIPLFSWTNPNQITVPDSILVDPTAKPVAAK